MATKWQYQSGAAKSKAKKRRITNEAKGKWTLEEFKLESNGSYTYQTMHKQDDEILLDTGCRLNVLPAAALELNQAQPRCDQEYEEDIINSETFGDHSTINNMNESDG